MVIAGAASTQSWLRGHRAGRPNPVGRLATARASRTDATSSPASRSSDGGLALRHSVLRRPPAASDARSRWMLPRPRRGRVRQRYESRVHRFDTQGHPGVVSEQLSRGDNSRFNDLASHADDYGSRTEPVCNISQKLRWPPKFERLDVAVARISWLSCWNSKIILLGDAVTYPLTPVGDVPPCTPCIAGTTS